MQSTKQIRSQSRTESRPKYECMQQTHGRPAGTGDSTPSHPSRSENLHDEVNHLVLCRPSKAYLCGTQWNTCSSKPRKLTTLRDIGAECRTSAEQQEKHGAEQNKTQVSQTRSSHEVTREKVTTQQTWLHGPCGFVLICAAVLVLCANALATVHGEVVAVSFELHAVRWRLVFPAPAERVSHLRERGGAVSCQTMCLRVGACTCLRCTRASECIG